MAVNIKNNEKTREKLQKHRLKNDKAKQCLELISELQQMAAENDMLALLTNKNFYNVITEIYCQVNELSRYMLIEMLMHLHPEPNIFVAFYNSLKEFNQALAENLPYEILGNSSIENDSKTMSQNLFFALLIAFHANSDFLFKVHLLKSALKVPFSSVIGTELTKYEIECFEVLFTASHRNPSLKETITNAFNYAKTIKNNDIQEKLQAFWGSVIPNQPNETYEIETILEYLKNHILPYDSLIEKSGILYPMPSAPSLEEIPEEAYYQPGSSLIL